MKKILILGWADIEKGALEGGGYNLTALHHALELEKRGSRVFYLQSGLHYSRSWLFGLSSKIKIKYTKKHKGIDCFTLWNSSHHAPSVFNNYPITKKNEELQIEIVTDWITKNGIDEVFVHSLEGHPLELLEAIKAKTGAVLKVFCHDHFYICPQVNLLYRKSICLADKNREEGCVNCFRFFKKGEYENYRARQQFLPGIINIILLKLKKKIFKKNLSERSFICRGSNNELIESLNINCNDRRKKAVSALNNADIIFTPTSFLSDTLISSGVSGNRIEVVKLGFPHLDRLKLNACKLEKHVRPDKNRIVFSYRGSDLPHKGVFFLLDAVQQLPDDIKKKTFFIFRGPGNSCRFDEYEKKLDNIRIYPSYNVSDLDNYINEYDIGILPHLWFENSPVTMLEHLASGKPVISSDLGGVSDYIKEGITGWLFRGGNTESFVEKISEIVNNKSFCKIDSGIINSHKSFIDKISSDCFDHE